MVDVAKGHRNWRLDAIVAESPLKRFHDQPTPIVRRAIGPLARPEILFLVNANGSAEAASFHCFANDAVSTCGCVLYRDDPGFAISATIADLVDARRFDEARVARGEHSARCERCDWALLDSPALEESIAA
jgi:hypothetical protein